MFASKKKVSENNAAAAPLAPESAAGVEINVNAADEPAAVEPQPEVAAAAAPHSAAPAAEVGAETEVWKNRYARLQADFDNFRKRQIREREETIRRANEGLIAELLPVLDHFDLALEAAGTKDDPFVQGVRIVADQLYAALAKAEARPIEAAGQLFTPERHEALGQINSTEAPAGHVAVQIRKGWLLGQYLLRPAQVMVSLGPPETEAADLAADVPPGA